ncbi:hypothetical protein LUI11_01030 [Bradyrhizobium diazoefficiens]|uniref:Uncharacterized protein n=1 Tax=Bradyrhizobium diazoefficiens SEMIA 5080 TaxID=754504 RepID=A0A837CKF6_9BRAD|nr:MULTISPECIES: hypothetical protein [Bradyrhizobium]KGJ69790.1 hypothetical protein BJA5080_04447 [Bradyrhizobium diazoefficiens SEMIA 5080]MCD9296951.1 hypothetical protein [Bradyrhizobium diazoefficiens]MCD9809969.1 hypothetical protein [Bradyrhizobium diazoefficiens]MCD9827086.1 hypothetical protein [Bradyrhizobium diazoefficiens]MCD9844955.1 hypothetical protein [Bradyrhizobium diazoefficiens]
MPDDELTRRGAGNNGFLRNGHETASSMIPELAAQYAARSSGAVISETSIKEITLVLNRRAQRGRRAMLLSRRLLDPRTQRKTALMQERGSNVTRKILKPDGCEFMHATAARCARTVPVA